MNIAILLYDRFTALDAIGPYEVLSRLPGASVTFVAAEAGPVRTDNGMLTLLAERSLDELREPDIVLVPGGPGEVAARAGGAALDWLREADETSTWTTSVCTGSLILAAAGLLDGRRATTPLARARRAAPPGRRAGRRARRLRRQARHRGGRFRRHRHGAGARRRGSPATPVAQAIQLGIEYDPQPPFDAGSPHKAPAEIVELLRDVSRFRGRSRLRSATVLGGERRGPANLRMPMAEHRYDPQEIEPRWQAVWARERTWEVSNEPTESRDRRAARLAAPTCSRCCPTRAASRTSAT